MFNNEFPPIGGGSATVNFKLFENWSKEDQRIHLLTCSLPNEANSFDFNSTIKVQPLHWVKIKNQHHSTISELIKFTIAGLFAGIKICRKSKVELLFAWSSVPSGFITLILSKIFKIPFVVRVSGPDIPEFEDRYRCIYPALRPILRIIWNNAECVVTKCQFESHEVLKHCPKAKIMPIANGTDINPEVIVRQFAKGEKLRVLCVARLIQRKGIEILLRAVGAIHQQGFPIELTIAGSGDAGDFLKRLTEELSLQKLVKFCGSISRGEISELYSWAHVFCLTSHNEGMSVATLEAVGAGLPTVVTDTGGASEIVIDAVNGFIVPRGDVLQTREALKRFFENPELITKMSRNAIEHSKTLSWSKVSKLYKELFRKLSFL